MHRTAGRASYRQAEGPGRTPRQTGPTAPHIDGQPGSGGHPGRGCQPGHEHHHQRDQHTDYRARATEEPEPHLLLRGVRGGGPGPGPAETTQGGVQHGHQPQQQPNLQDPDPEGQEKEEEKQQAPLKIIYCNARSIVSKLDHISILLNDECIMYN